VAALTREATLSRAYRARLTAQQHAYLRELLPASILYGLSQSLSLFAMGLAFWYGGTLIARRTYTVQQFFICFVSIIWGSQAAAGLFSYANEIGRARFGCIPAAGAAGAVALYRLHSPASGRASER
jgi:ATP-binding cassette subfamily B (MDR/TAP) protein 1